MFIFGLVFLFFSRLYQIAHLGDADDEPEFSSSTPLEEGETFYFRPREAKNLIMVDELQSLSPIMHCKVCAIVSVVVHQHNLLYDADESF